VRRHRTLLGRLEGEERQREAHFARHIASTTSMIEREREHAEMDGAAFAMRLGSLQQMLRHATRRGAQQLQGIGGDIEKLKRAVDDARKGEEAAVVKTREDAAKWQETQTEALWKRRRCEQIQADVARTLREIENAKREQQRSAVTAAPARTSFRSVFLP